MSGGEDGSIEVVLDEVSGEGPAGGGGDPRRTRRRRRRLVGVGLVVVAAVGVTSAVMTAQDDRRERDRREALADVPGILPRLDGSLHEAWSVDDAWFDAVGRDVVVVSALLGDGHMTGVDLRTGEEVWTRPIVGDETCTTLSGDSAPAQPTVDLAPVDLLACYRFFATAEGNRVVVGDPASVAVLDVTTGTQVATVPTPADVLGVELAGSDVVVASLDQDGAVVVSRWALPESPGGPARQVWTQHLPEPLERIDRTGWVFHVEADVVRVGTVGSVPLDLATGEPRPDAGRDGVLYTMEAPLPGGGRVEWDFDGAAMGTGASRVVPAGGGDGVELDGVPWLPDVTDGSVPGVLLLRRASSVTDVGSGTGDLVAVDPVSGTDLWAAGRMAGMVPLVQLEGILVTAGAGRVVAMDVRDGEVVWEDRADGVGHRPSALTDGDTMVLPQGAGADLALVARDVRTGVERWRTTLDALGGESVGLVPTGAGVLVLTGGRVSLLAP